MFTSYFYKFLKLFSKGYKYKLILLFTMSVIAGFLEFLGISLIYPFILILINPAQAHKIPLLNLEFYGSGLMFLSCLIIGAFVAKNIFMIANTYYQTSTLKRWQCFLNLTFFKKYLYSSYESKLTLPSNYSIFQVWQLCSITFSNFISRVLYLFSSVIILTVILAFLVWKFKFWAVLTGLFFLISGLIQNKFFKTKGRELIKKHLELMDLNNKSILSAIKNIKDIKIFAKENYFFEKYKLQSEKMTNLDIWYDFFNAIPQNIVEICIIASIILLGYGIVTTSHGSSETIIASFAMLAAAMFRIAPLINKIQMHMNFINANKPVVQELFNAYENYKELSDKEILTAEKTELRQGIKVCDMSFGYKEKNILSNINIDIKKGEFIGITGASGIGKTTFVDILMGLLTSYSGQIYVDGIPLGQNNLQQWTNAIGYVPQEITTLPVTVAENIAFGVEPENIDYEKLNYVIKITRLEDYINSLENGIKTTFGSIQSLSQGQKQRIGLARALYKEPQILFLDEVTSALDVETESKITDCLNTLKGKMTIIAIAHRLSTLKSCDRILYFKSGSEILSGRLEDLRLKDESFNNLVKLSKISD